MTIEPSLDIKVRVDRRGSVRSLTISAQEVAITLSAGEVDELLHVLAGHIELDRNSGHLGLVQR